MRPARVKGVLYTKQYTLRGVGKNIEVWLALAPARMACWAPTSPRATVATRSPASTTINDAEIAALSTSTTTHAAQGVQGVQRGPARDGSRNRQRPDQGLDFSVTQQDRDVDRQRARHRTSTEFPKTNYVAGFFSAQFNDRPTAT